METLNEIDKLGADLLAKMPEILEKGAEYGGDLFEKFITYAISIEIAAVVFPLALIVPAKYIHGRVLKSLKKESYSYDSNATGCAVVFGLVAGLLAFISIMNLFCSPNVFEAIFIPELYIINYFN